MNTKTKLINASVLFEQLKQRQFKGTITYKPILLNYETVMYASLARQVNVQKVILGVDGTAAGFFDTFWTCSKKV